MKLERLDINGTKLEKAEMSLVKGGTSTTEFTQTGVAENEQELDKDGNKIGEPILVDMPI
ncbi:MAG: hypothetical protein PHE35_05460 [Bacteroidales bacterium]|jgi:hypothetical protein|nr:hypothetical protein [Bacteroidales bacterium]MDD2771233.1 hypothetical protein [Bacteroidales bacterium]MDD3105082.1 hypothetical protein [Bacteroidales bacterium]MDY0182303.1 hypothetical protein [Proteiniphilum sp.]